MKNNRGKFEQQTFYISHQDFSYCIRGKPFVMKFSMKDARMDKVKRTKTSQNDFCKKGEQRVQKSLMVKSIVSYVNIYIYITY